MFVRDAKWNAIVQLERELNIKRQSFPNGSIFDVRLLILNDAAISYLAD